MSDQTYPGIRLGTQRQELYLPYVNQDGRYIRSGIHKYDTPEGAWEWLAPEVGDVVVREVVTVTREVVRQIPPVDHKRERDEEWANEGEPHPEAHDER